MTTETFICAWCREAFPDEPAVYTHPRRHYAGRDALTMAPLCEGCVDAADEVYDTPEDVY